MSLDADYTAIPNWKTVCYRPEGGLTWQTETLVFLTPVLGMPVLDSKTLPEFLSRILQYDLAYGSRAFVRPDGTDCSVTEILEVLGTHLGLRTNVRRHTETQFSKLVAAIIRDRALKEARVVLAPKYRRFRGRKT